jgi:formylglycine-generating enzyme required for sulfatase activity
MSQQLRCSKGHFWASVTSDVPPGKLVVATCPVCGELVSDAPQDTIEVAQRTDPYRPALAVATVTDSATDRPEVPGYDIEGVLGRGGMGVVYKAKQVKANRLVALKMILSQQHADLHDKVRFQIEGEAVARLQHPNIVQLFEVGEAEGLPFFSLEFCAGGALDARPEGKLRSPREAAVLLEKLARAMHCAHARGVVHRDLKPANVLLGSNGEPKITDFGLAKRLDAASDLSQTGNIIGTPAYMAPEQAEGRIRDIGPATDIWALGTILYELLTGAPPFRGPTLLDTLALIRHLEPAAPWRVNPQVPRDLGTICLKCLEKAPAKRYGSAEELADELRRYLDGEPIRARPINAWQRGVKWARRNTAVATLLAGVVLALSAGTIVSLSFAFHASAQAEQARRKEAEARAKEQEALSEADKAKKARDFARTKEQEALSEADKAKKARDFLVSVFQIPATDIGTGKIMTTREILNQAEQRIPIEFATHPELRADLLAAIDIVNRNLAKTIPAAMILEARGSIQLQTARGIPVAVAPQVLLYPDDRLTLGADSHLQLVVLSDLHKEQLRPGTEALLSPRGCQPDEVVQQRSEDVLMTFARLPKGTFYKGGGGGKVGTKTEIKEDFEIAVHPVTAGQWQAIMGYNPSDFSREGGWRNSVLGISDEELQLFPVVGVSWHETQEFIKRLNERERGKGYLYRLPTDAEWEYACRGGATSEEECSYHFYFDKPTNDLSSEQANFAGSQPFGNAPKGKYLARPSRVGAYPANKLGVCDMHGNVQQWCADLVGENGSLRVIRGGPWGGMGLHCVAAFRQLAVPTDRTIQIGLRLARVPEGPQQ